MIDVLRVSPQFHHLMQAFDDMHGESPIDGDGALDKILYSNIFINLTLWNIYGLHMLLEQGMLLLQ